MKYENYKVMVAGSTSGIGLAITKMFISEGATVIGLGRNFENTKELGDKYIPCKCDVTDPAQIENACNFIKETFDGKLDVLVDSAGLGVKQPVTDVPVERFDLAINLLLRHHILFTSQLHECLYNCDSKDPVVIHISSAASRSIESDNILYGMCKTACNLFAKQCGKGLHGIRTFTISPGTIVTPIFNRDKNAQRSPEQIKAMFDQLSMAIPCGRVADPSEVSDLVSFLCSKEASYMTGTDCLIDGGIMTQF
ncbi:MAG: SDR family oxidoreductase [Oscillospiraceae bacterium]